MEKPTYADNWQYRREDIMRLVLYYNATYSIGRGNYMRFNFSDSECRIFITGKYDFHNSYGIGMQEYNIFCVNRYDDFGYIIHDYYTSLQNAGDFLVNHEIDILSAFDQCDLYAQTLSWLRPDWVSERALPSHDDWKSPWHYLDYKPKSKKYQKKP